MMNNYDLQKDFLPVGSIVKIRFDYDKLMIIGYCTVEKGTNKVFDYCAVRYPFGFIGNDKFVMFNKDVVKKVIQLGYESDEQKDFIELINKNIKDGKLIKYDEKGDKIDE